MAPSLVSSNARCVQLSEELAESIKELQSMEEHRAESKVEIKKLKEQLSQAEQIHRGELEGMRKEILRLTQELHQRDITIASAGGSTSDLEQRLRMEIERAERKAVEHRMILVQLETLKLENRHLLEMLEKVELGVLEGKDATLRALSEDYVVELNKLKSENQQLKKDLSEAREKLELTTQSQPEGTAQQLQSEEPEPRDVQHRTTQESQHKQDEQTEKIHHKPDKTTQHHQRWKIQPLPAEIPVAVIPEAAVLPTQTSRKSCVESPTLAADALQGTDSLLLVLDDGKGFPDAASRQSNHKQESVPLCPLPTSSVGSVAARYLEEEELRSQHILECLDAHIEELKKESEKIVRHFGHQE